jgi:hypothetical protein
MQRDDRRGEAEVGRRVAQPLGQGAAEIVVRRGERETLAPVARGGGDHAAHLLLRRHAEHPGILGGAARIVGEGEHGHARGARHRDHRRGLGAGQRPDQDACALRDRLPRRGGGAARRAAGIGRRDLDARARFVEQPHDAGVEQRLAERRLWPGQRQQHRRAAHRRLGRGRQHGRGHADPWLRAGLRSAGRHAQKEGEQEAGAEPASGGERNG